MKDTYPIVDAIPLSLKESYTKLGELQLKFPYMEMH